MTPNKRTLRAYARFDGNGMIVPGSVTLRKSKPKNGKWFELRTYECCEHTTTTTTTILSTTTTSTTVLV